MTSFSSTPAISTIYQTCFNQTISSIGAAGNTGIGTNGVIALTNSNTADLGMKLFNADGSGVCVAVAAAIKTGKMKFEEKISVEQTGRVLQVVVKEDFREVILEGEAVRVFKGEID